MSFRDNLQHLRSTRNMTQEQLAMLVGVSRQSVTKWEAERSYPEMDKLLKICQIFDCSLDDLVQGDLTQRQSEPELAVPMESMATDVVGYDEHHRKYALRMSLGVAACILGPALAAGLESYGDAPMAFAVLGLVAVGLGLIIPASFEHSAFMKAHPYVTDFYDSDQRMAERRVFGVRLAIGIGIILLSVASGSLVEGDVPLFNALFLVGVALGVFLIVYGSLMENRLDVEDYNISALEEVSEEDIAGIVGEDRAAVVLAKVRRNKRKGAACGIIMIVATAIALPLLFWATQSGNEFWIRYFWVFWMLGGLFCAIASIIIDQRG